MKSPSDFYRECLYAALESISEMNLGMHEVWGWTAQCEVLQPLTGHDNRHCSRCQYLRSRSSGCIPCILFFIIMIIITLIMFSMSFAFSLCTSYSS